MTQEITLQDLAGSIKVLTELVVKNQEITNQKFEGLTESMLKNFDRLEKKVDDTRVELKEDLRAVVRVSSLVNS